MKGRTVSWINEHKNVAAILILEAENLQCLTNDGIDANVPGVSQS